MDPPSYYTYDVMFDSYIPKHLRLCASSFFLAGLPVEFHQYKHKRELTFLHGTNL